MYYGSYLLFLYYIKSDMIQYLHFITQNMAYSLSPPSFGKSMLELRTKYETLNVGTRWTIEEDNRLVQEIK